MKAKKVVKLTEAELKEMVKKMMQEEVKKKEKKA
jgi:hypothetical protein